MISEDEIRQALVARAFISPPALVCVSFHHAHGQSLYATLAPSARTPNFDSKGTQTYSPRPAPLSKCLSQPWTTFGCNTCISLHPLVTRATSSSKCESISLMSSTSERNICTFLHFLPQVTRPLVPLPPSARGCAPPPLRRRSTSSSSMMLKTTSPAAVMRRSRKKPNL